MLYNDVFSAKKICPDCGNSAPCLIYKGGEKKHIGYRGRKGSYRKSWPFIRLSYR